MANRPYRNQAPVPPPAIAHTVWSAFVSLLARNTAHAMMADASTPGSVRMLWRFLPALLQRMLRCWGGGVVGGDEDQQARFESLLAAIDSVH